MDESVDPASHAQEWGVCESGQHCGGWGGQIGSHREQE